MSLYLLDTFRFPTIGEAEFACSDTEYFWRVPVGVTSITCVLVGGGGGGRAGANQQDGAGGGGGALRWVNNMVVVPGEILRIKVGLGGTGCDTTAVTAANRAIAWGRPGQDSYIASDNNASVPARVGIGGTIIVKAEGGGWDNYVTDQIRKIPAGQGGFTGIEVDERTAGSNSQEVRRSVGVGTSGGQGTVFGSYSWGTVGGGNGGTAGVGGGVGGGQDGGGGGAGGYRGNGGNGGSASGDQIVSSGKGGGGGGGQFGGQGGGNAAGGGGGVGVFWGAGPNGLRAGYYWDSSALIINDTKTNNPMSGSGGQGGSFGADGRATGCDITANVIYKTVNVDTYYPNQSNGNGRRGFDSSVDSAANFKPDGGLYGGGGGGADGSSNISNPQPISGDGACGRVRILWAVRTDRVVREYGAGRGNTGITTNRRGVPFTVTYDDWDTRFGSDTNTQSPYNWPAWNPTPASGSYNLLVNWAVNLESYSYVLTGGGTGVVGAASTSGSLPALITAGISSNPENYTIPSYPLPGGG